ncbi:MAG: response regulator transcription factor [Acidobacteria bacterium]|nr:response regulator transcription factor [Acidobacteriota bacterium]
MIRPIRILFVDDHTLFRESVIRLLEREPAFTIAGHCASLAEARLLIRAAPTDVVLLDYDLGAELGTDLLLDLRRSSPSTKVLMVTGGMGASAILNAVDAGISGLILKHSDPRQLIEAIRTLADGGSWWDPAALPPPHHAAQASAPAEAPRALTDRQRHVLRSILDGLSNKEIAAKLQVSESAIKASIQELFLKAGVRTRSQLVRVAIERYSSDWLQQSR